MNVLANLARMSSATTGTGALTLTALSGGQALSFADAGIANGQEVTYAVEDYDATGAVIGREIGRGTYSSAGPTLARTEVYDSTNGGAAINCSGRQHVFITAAKEDFESFLSAASVSAFGLTLIDDPDAATARTTLGLGTMAVETATNYLTTAAAASTYQPLDGDLTALAALSGTNTIYYRSAADTWSAVTVSASLGFSGGTLGGSLASSYQPLDSDLTAIAALTSAADKVPYATGAGTWALSDFSSVARTLVSQTTQALMRSTGLGLGTAATQNTGTTGANVPLLNGANIWSANQIIQSAGPVIALRAESGDATARLVSVSGNASSFRLGHWTGAAAQDRWLVGKDVVAESGSDVGSSLSVYYYTDAGVFKGTAFTAYRTDGSFNFSTGIYAATATGGYKGAGTINFVTIYENGTALSSKYGALASANVWTAAQTVRIDNATTNAVTVGATLSHTTTGTPANGIGVSLAFEAETTAGNNEVGATIEAVVTDVTSTSEDFDLVFKTMAAGAAAAERMRIKSTGTVLHGTAALNTTATDGFVYVPTCAGTPTGVPTAHTGMAPIVVDSTNNKLYFYSGGAWRDAGP
jgi:hypothetical protein